MQLAHLFVPPVRPCLCTPAKCSLNEHPGIKLSEPKALYVLDALLPCFWVGDLWGVQHPSQADCLLLTSACSCCNCYLAH